MLRFASSPIADMSVGELRVALLNYIVSKQRNEDFIVRIEDMEKEKNIEGKDQEILDILNLFGIEHSQVVYQSQNVRFHSAMALQLLHEKKAFNCFCSDEWLEKKQQEAKESEQEYSYDDACRNLPAELVIDNMAPFRIRINRPDQEIVMHDKVKGDVSFSVDAVDSFVIMNQDKTPTSNFASAIDDMLSDISFIICDEEQIKNTPRQEHIRNSLSYDKKLEYAHLPTILDERSVKSLLEEGFLPETISNYLISIGNKPQKEIFTLKEAQEWFTFDTFSDSPAHFDMDILRHLNKEHLKMLDAKELSRYVGFADTSIGELARVYLDEASTTKELKAKVAPIFAPKVIPDDVVEYADRLKAVIIDAPYFESYDAFTKYLMEESGLRGKSLYKPLRILLTGVEDGPDISELYQYIKNYIGEIVK